MIFTRINFLGVLKLLNVPIFLMAKFKLAVYVVSISLLNHTIRYMHSLLDRIHDLSFGSKHHADLRDIPKNGLTLKLSINQLCN